MIRIEFNVAPVLAKLAAARAVLTDMTPVFADIGESMVKSTKERFPAGIGPDGTRWREKRPATLAAYLRRGDGRRPHPLMGATGRLGNEIVPVVGRDQVEIGSSLIYSAVQQFGAAKGAFGPRTPWGDIPARPFLGVSADDERTIIEIVDDHLDEATRP